MRRPAACQLTPGEVAPFPDADWVKRFPSLVEQLHDPFWEDGSVRELCTLSIKEQDGLILVSLQDRELERGLYRTGRDVKAALDAIEKALVNLSADWRPWKQAPRKGGK